MNRRSSGDNTIEPEMIIREAKYEDASAIADIWNPVIKDTVTTFTNLKKSTIDIEMLLSERARLNHGFYVTLLDNMVEGFATYDPFRAGPGYAHTMEHSIFLTKATQGRGIGKALMQRLESHAKKREIHSLIAGSAAENQNAIGFHQAIGYIEVANIKQAGFKFDRWHDLVLMQKLL